MYSYITLVKASSNIHLSRNAVAIILKVAYGYEVESNDDPLVLLIEKSFKLTASINVPGKFWVEFFPIRKLLKSFEYEG